MHKNPSMGIRGLMPEIGKVSGLADPDRTSEFIQDSEKIFREVEVSGTALFCSHITSVAGPDEVSVIACGLRQVLGGSLTLGIAE
jgi:hypothetical protein